jgi:two-component system sensor histidine kinase TctE
MVSREKNFSTMVAHQLRTPLTSLQLGLARAADAPDLRSARAVIAELSRATQRSARLVQQLLALGRLDPEAGRGPGFQNTDLVRLIRDIGAAHADQAVSKDIDFELISVNDEVVAEVQPDLFAEAVSNLIDNAIRYTPAGGRVSVEIQSAPVRVLVSDSGPGLPLDDRERVFERFVRGRLAQGEGSGLGLAIVRDIAALHRATVEITDGPWGGLTFVIAFGGDAAAPSDRQHLLFG